MRSSISTVFSIVTLICMTLGVAGCGTTAQIEWSNFITVHGITYVASFTGDTTLPPSLQGSQYAKVRFKVADHVSDPAYQAQDGDAAFLPIGTPIYQVNGYRPDFRLAAMWNGQSGHLTIYEASDIPHAQTGADLLDIRDKVVRVGVLWNIDTPPGFVEHGSITDPAIVQSLVAAVLASPLRTNPIGSSGTQVFIAFHLRDSTEVVRVLYPVDHNLAGIQVPDTFVQAIQPLLPPPTPQAASPVL